MNIFSGVYHEDRGRVLDQENDLTLECSRGIASAFSLVDSDIVSGNYVDLGGALVVTAVRTINFEPYRSVQTQRRSPVENLWWGEVAEEVSRAGDVEEEEDEDEASPEEFVEPVTRTEELLTIGAGRNPYFGGSVNSDLTGYADMVNRSMELESQWVARLERDPSNVEVVNRIARGDIGYGINAAQEVLNEDIGPAAVHNPRPQRRPNIPRGGRRQW